MNSKNPVTFRIPPDMLAFLGKRAAIQRRTLSDYVRLVLEDHRLAVEAATKRPKPSTLNDYVRLARKEVEAQKRASKEERHDRSRREVGRRSE